MATHDISTIQESVAEIDLFDPAKRASHSPVLGELELSKRKTVDSMNWSPLQAQNQQKLQTGSQRLLSAGAAQEKRGSQCLRKMGHNSMMKFIMTIENWSQDCTR